MQPTNGMDRAQFHDKAWAMWQEKALGSALLPKLSIHAIRTLWDVLYDSMATLNAPAQGEPEAPVSGLSRTQCNAIEYFVTQMRGVESAVYADMFDAFLGYINSLVGPVLTPQPAPAVAKEGMTEERILEIAAPHFNVSESCYGEEFNPHPQYHGSDLSVIAFARALLTKGE